MLNFCSTIVIFCSCNVTPAPAPDNLCMYSGGGLPVAEGFTMHNMGMEVIDIVAAHIRLLYTFK